MCKKILTLPETETIGIDEPGLIAKRFDIIKSKQFLKKIYREWYDQIIKTIPEGTGKVLEIGSGGGFLKEILPEVITSEFFDIPGLELDLEIDACKNLPFNRNELKAIVMVDVLHHLPDVANFFRIAAKCLKSGGRIIMLEPWFTPWSGFVYRNLHHEAFNTSSENWSFKSTGPLSDANGALPWIIFNRDLLKFKQEFPYYEITEIRKTMPFSYLFSGGVSYKSFLPGCFYRLVRGMEKSLKVESMCAMFAYITVQKLEN